MTADHIMVFNGYTDKSAMDYDEVKTALLHGLEERDHEKPEMAALGKKQYHVVRTQTSESSGKVTEDTFTQGTSVDEKVADKLVKTFDADDFTVKPIKDGPNIQIEAWKKSALDLEKKMSALKSRAGKLLQTATTVSLRLGKRQDDKMAAVQKENLDEKKEVLEKALATFTTATSDLDSKNEVNAKKEAEMAEPAMATLREHCIQFDKVLRLASGYMNMVG